MKMKLTDLAVRGMKPPPAGKVTVWEKSSPIGVRVACGGTKTYIVLTGPGQRRSIDRSKEWREQRPNKRINIFAMGRYV
jgi:hypothetical protein